ncbi:MAG: thioredoxin family protein [Planctomycetota bacterium]
MRSLAFIAAVVAGSLAVAEPIAWRRDLPAAQQEAIASDKPLLVLLTGQAWCHNCVQLERHVLTKPEFAKAVSGRYVCVELDYTFEDTPDDRTREERLRGFQKRFAAPAVPTIVLADAELRPFAHVVGYDEEKTPADYVARLADAHAAWRRLVEAGDEPQEAWALAGLASHLSTSGQSAEDAWLDHYAERAGELLNVLPSDSPERAELAGVLAERRGKRQWASAFARANERVNAFELPGQADEVLAYLKSEIPAAASPELKRHLEAIVINVLDRSDRHDEMLQHVRRLRTQGEWPPSESDRLISREARALVQLDQRDEMIEVFDMAVAEARSSSDMARVRRLVAEKLQFTVNDDRLDVLLEVVNECHRVFEAESEERRTASFVASVRLRRAERFEEALGYLEELLAGEPWVGHRLDAAECLMELGRIAEAERYLALAGAEVATLAESARVGERRDAARFAARLQGLQWRLEERQARGDPTMP